MAKSPKQAARGRPKSENPLSVMLHVRITPEIRKGIEKYQAKYGNGAELRGPSDAARHIIKKLLRQEGLLD